MDVPRYRDLPVLANGLRAAWGVFGPGDDLGTINFLTPEAVAHAATEVRTGQRVNVSLSLTEPSPPFFGRAPLRHTLFDYSPVVLDDVLDNFYLQASTQWDGLRHRKDAEVGFWDGVQDDDAGPRGDRLGVDAWAKAGGIVGRGVLVDVARVAPTGYDPLSSAIDADLLQHALREQGTELRAGDVLMVRTGYRAHYAAADTAERIDLGRTGRCGGLAPTEEVVELLWDSRVAAVAVDNPAVEVIPPDRSKPMLHGRAIPMLGLALGEFFDLEVLAVACAEDSRWTGMFVSVPLNLPRGVGSPANAVVVR